MIFNVVITVHVVLENYLLTILVNEISYYMWNDILKYKNCC